MVGGGGGGGGGGSGGGGWLGTSCSVSSSSSSTDAIAETSFFFWTCHWCSTWLSACHACVERGHERSRPADEQRWAESWGSPRHAAALAMYASLQGAGWRRVSRLAPDRVPCLLEVTATDERTHGVRSATQRPHARQIEVREDCLLHLGRKVLQHLSLRHRNRQAGPRRVGRERCAERARWEA